MLHIKSNNEPVVGVDSLTGTSRSLGTLEFISGGARFEVSPLFNNNLVFKDKWASILSSYVQSQVKSDNTIDRSQSLTVMSFNGASDIFLDINTEHDLQYYGGGALLKLKRNTEQHMRQTDAFSVRVAHRVHCSTIADGETIQRNATFKTPTVADESVIGYKFTQRSFANSGWDYIQFFDQNGNQIDRSNISATSPPPDNYTSTDWVDFRSDRVFTKDGIRYYAHDCYLKKVGTNLELRSAQVYFTTSGRWDITFDDKIALAYKNLAVGKKLRIRFVFATSAFAPEGLATPIPLSFNASTKLARASKLESSNFSPDGTIGTFKFNRACFVSSYINGVQVGDKVQTTAEGEITVNFNRNVNEGAVIELRVSSAFPQIDETIFTVNVADIVAPPPITASIFLADRIFGQGGASGDFAVAERDGIEIGRATISSTLEYIITLNEGVTLTTGELIEVYAMDSAGNKSATELYEIEVSISAEGAFNPDLGNDSLTTITQVS